MQALATPLVSILHQDGALTFSRESGTQGRTVFVARKESLDQLSRSRPGSVFEVGDRWQMVPTKLYRYEDRYTYLKEQYPHINPQHIGVLALPHLEAMGIFDRNSYLPESLFSGNHVAELFLIAAEKLGARMPTHALAFFLEDRLWLTVTRRASIVFCQSVKIKGDADAIFNLASIFEHFDLDRSHTPVLVAGLIGKDGQLYRQLSIYYDVRELKEELAAGPYLPSLQLLLAYQRALKENLVANPAQ